MKRLAILCGLGWVLCSGSVAALERLTEREEAKMADMVTVKTERPTVDSSMAQFKADHARLQQRSR